MLFSRRGARTTGIDISYSGVALVNLTRRQANPQITGFGYTSLPEGAIVGGDIHKPQQVIEAIVNSVQQSRSKPSRVAVAMVEGAVLTKTITLPAHLNQNEVDEKIAQELERFVPWASDDTALDYRILPSTQKTQSQFVIVACLQSKVAAICACLEEASIQVKAVDAHPWARERGITATTLGQTETTKALLHFANGNIFTTCFKVGDAAIRTTESLDMLMAAPANDWQVLLQEAQQIYLSGHLPQGFKVLLQQQLMENQSIVTPFANQTDTKHFDNELLHNLAPELLGAYGLALW